jgi:hypothetical protein
MSAGREELIQARKELRLACLKVEEAVLRLDEDKSAARLLAAEVDVDACAAVLAKAKTAFVEEQQAEGRYTA